jgi:Na+/H+ antiporter NhaD/arsenite permease-like protein
MNFVTAPLIADLFLLAILAIGREEVYAGTVGSDHIYPLDVMAFFITLAYIAISLDTSGLIRWLAFKVLQKAGKHGRRLFLYLYLFFFSLASFIGNDPIILSGTPFLAYMTRVAENIKHPRAWIHTQFTLANIGSAVLVTSNPTNLVLAGAFKIKFIVYTANIIVPVVATTILLFPFLLYINFHNESLIPRTIKLHELPEESKSKQPVNPNIPFSKGIEEDEDEDEESEESKLSSLEEVMNPYLDKWSAGFGAGIMAVTLITILAINASIQNGEGVPAFYVTLPAAVVTFCRDVFSGWRHRQETRSIARKGREAVDHARSQRETRVPLRAETSLMQPVSNGHATTTELEKEGATTQNQQPSEPSTSPEDASGTISSEEVDEKGEIPPASKFARLQQPPVRATLVSVVNERWMWCRETFPTVTTVLRNLPYPLVPFALCMFVLVQGLVTRGWIAVFAYGWSHWVNKTGTVGAIGGMAFLSVILCNFAGTNIGTAILLCRVVQAWVQIHKINSDPISQRTFWATIYSMTIGLNFGAFSTCFSASLAGLLWRDILRRKRIIVKELDFARVNLSIIAFTTAVACAVLIGEVYITRNETPYQDSA